MKVWVDSRQQTREKRVRFEESENESGGVRDRENNKKDEEMRGTIISMGLLSGMTGTDRVHLVYVRLNGDPQVCTLWSGCMDITQRDLNGRTKWGKEEGNTK